MKKIYVLLVLTVLTTTLLSPSVVANDSIQLKLPKEPEESFGKGWVNDIKFSSNGDELAVATTVGIWIYEVRTGKGRNLFEGVEGYVGGANTLSYVPNGSTLAAAHQDWKIRFWNVNTGNLTSPSLLKGHTETIHTVAYSPDRSMLASGSADKTIRVWDAQTGKPLLILPGYKETVYTVAFSSDSSLLAGGSKDGTIRVWDAGTGEQIYEFNKHTDAISKLDFSPDGKSLASASLDGTVLLWDLIAPSGKEPIPMQHDAQVYAVKFSPNGYTFATASADKLIRIWNISTRQLVTILKGHNDAVWSIDYSPDGSILASGSLDGTVRLWEVVRERQRLDLGGHTGGVKALAYTEDNRIRACGTGPDDKLRLWDAGTSSQLSTLLEHTGLTQAVAFSKNGEKLASGGSEDGTIFLSNVTAAIAKSTDLDNKSLLSTLTGNTHGITALALSPSGTLLATGGADGRIHLLDTISGKELEILRGPEGTITALTFNKDGTALFSGEENGTIREWNALSGKEQSPPFRGSFSAITSLASSSDAPFLAIGDENGAIAIRDETGTIRLFGHNTQFPETEFRRHIHKVTALVFSKDNTTLISGSEDGTIFRWTIKATPQTTQEIVQNARNSTVYLEMRKTDGRISQGSGFFIRPNYVATNYHVIEGGTEAYIKLVGQETTYTVESIAATDKKHDLAVLKLSGITAPALQLADSDTVQIGEDVYAVGNPQGWEGTVSNGIISSIRGEGNNKWIQITAAVSPGSSGGAVLNSKGEVIGIATIAYFKIDPRLNVNRSQNLNFAVPSNYLKALLQQVQ